MVAGASLACWRRSNEGKVNCDLLLKELLAVRALDRGVCFFEGGIFNENVALATVNMRF